VDKETIENLAESLTGKLVDAVPEGMTADAAELRDDLRHNFKGLLRSTLDRMDLVTRDEFDVQRKVLERTREKLEALERELAELQKPAD